MPSLNQVFIKDISVFCCIELSLYPEKSPGSAAEKHPNSMMQPQACFTMEGGGGGGIVQVMSSAWFSTEIMLRIYVHQTRESCFSQSEKSFRSFL